MFRKNTIPFPLEFLKMPLTRSEIMVWVAVRAHSLKKESTVALKTLEQDTGLSYRMIHRALLHLESLGLLRSRKRGKWKHVGREALYPEVDHSLKFRSRDRDFVYYYSAE